MENLQPQSKPAVEKKSTDFVRYFLYAVFVIAGILAAKFAFVLFSPKNAKQPAPSRPAVAVASRTPQPVAASTPSPFETVKKKILKPATSAFVLNGLYQSGEERYALVNNKIVQEGETVDGATVTSIGEDEVELSQNGKTIRLTTYK